MRAGIKTMRWSNAVLFLGMILLVSARSINAQEESPTAPAPQAPCTQGKDSTKEMPPCPKADDYSAPTVYVGQREEEPPIRKIKGAGAFNAVSSAHWGPIYLGSIEFNELIDDFRPTGQPATTTTVSTIRSYIFVDRQYRQSRFTFQYQPSVTISQGQVDPNFVSQNINLDSYYRWSPRWTVTFNDHFSYYNSRSRFGDSFLDSDSISSTTQQNGFLDGPQEVLWNSASIGFTNRLSPRTSFTLTPTYAYARTSANLTAAPRSSQGGGVSALLRHDLSPLKSVEIHYSVQHSQFSSTFGDTTYQTAGVGYSQQFPGKWGLSAGAGASNANSTDFGRFWTVTGALSVVKSFKSSSVSLAYTRGENNGDYLTNRYTDRSDLSSSTQWTRRLQTRGGIGYQREVGSQSGIWGKYATGQVSARLFSSATFFVYYVHKWQKGDAQQLFTGSRGLLAAGIRWDFVREAH
jgi:hypothetical protein